MKVEDLIAAVNKNAKKTVGGLGLAIPDPVRLASGILGLDLAIGGGFPLGRVNVIYGMEAAMKTALLLKLIANHQRLFPHLRCVFIDVEQHLLQSWAEMFGVNWSELLYIRPESGEQVVDIMEGMMQADNIGILGLDSLAALMPQREIDADAETANVGTAGLLINKLYRRIGYAYGEAGRNETPLPTLVLINQIRYKIGVMFGDPETMPGGPSIKFASSLTVRLNGSDEFAKKTDKLPTFKYVKGQVKKHKVPILSRNFEYKIALKEIPELKLKFGECYSWNTILLYLKKLGLLTQEKDGWQLTALVAGVKTMWDTQDVLKDKYQDDVAFGERVRKVVIDRALIQGDPIVETDSEG